MTRHFLTLNDLADDELNTIVRRGIQLKQELAAGRIHEPMKNGTLAMIFEKSSTRTRVSFEVAATQFGGSALFIAPGDSQLGRGEPISDTARVLSSMTRAIVMRTHSHERIEELARYSRVPVINGLTDRFHPCQLLADLQTWFEHRDEIRGATVAWIGDGNNMCHSWCNASRKLGFRLRIATPDGYQPDADIVAANRDTLELGTDPMAAATGADLVVTDTWASMGQEDEKQARTEAFREFTVDRAMMEAASADALFMHCLPAYRGYEVTAEVLEGPQSVVWDQAENRLHAQKALLEFLLLEQAR
jgi:ornithine carbamoyltransferase